MAWQYVLLVLAMVPVLLLFFAMWRSRGSNVQPEKDLEAGRERALRNSYFGFVASVLDPPDKRAPRDR